MIREEIREDAGASFIGKTDAQILRELYGIPARRRIARPGEQSEHRNKSAATPDGETETQAH
jgi:hypothetical protein